MSWSLCFVHAPRSSRRAYHSFSNHLLNLVFILDYSWPSRGRLRSSRWHITWKVFSGRGLARQSNTAQSIFLHSSRPSRRLHMLQVFDIWSVSESASQINESNRINHLMESIARLQFSYLLRRFLTAIQGERMNEWYESAGTIQVAITAEFALTSTPA